MIDVLLDGGVAVQEHGDRLTYKGYVLDRFQREAVNLIEDGRSVVVCAPTGVGKTLIADYLIEKAVSENRRVIYTAPIKALSNQKYRQFKASLGEEKVGIITGDVVLNREAMVLMMTTEIYRNMVLSDPDSAADIHYVIFDEIHYIDSDRGVAWEESLIFAPPHVRFLGLSATIGNLDQFVAWLSAVRQQPVAQVLETKRAVPLSHRYFNAGTGICTLDGLKHAMGEGRLRPTDHLQLVRALRRDYLPALMFVFSRRQCVEKARELARERSFLTAAEAAQVERQLDACELEYGLSGHGEFLLLRRLLQRGIAFHHAGLLPVLKGLVEELFEQRLIKLLYCTETFAVGVNYPVKSVCFLEQRKWDGSSVRPLTIQEYQQMSGRAGRRGIDTQGYVFTLISNAENVILQDYARGRPEDIGSQYRLSCNSILNLIRRGMEGQIGEAYRSSFAAYLNEQTRRQLEEQRARLLADRDALFRQFCDAVDSIACPILYQRRRSKLRGMERQLKQGKRYLQRPVARLRQELSRTQPRACGSRRVGNCRSCKRQLQDIAQRLTLLEAELAMLPTANDWLQQYNSLKRRLEHLGYLDGSDILPRGELASSFNFQEILITEFVFAGMLDELSVPEICGLLCGVDFVGRFSDFTAREPLPALRKYFRIAEELKSDPVLGPQIIYSHYVASLGYRWAKGDEFEALVEITTILEGDIVSLLRRTVDVLRQLRKGLAQEPFWGSKLALCLEAMERDVVKVEL
ncbi:MAG: DEAD/DEAH box helicase [Bacillota bacterium]|jgi:ATP-dependent RNA helicase DOB1